MNAKNEGQMARHMLIHHQQGYSVLRVLRRAVWRYALLGIAWAVLLGFLYAMDSPGKPFFAWASGALMGVMVRDVGWFRLMRKSWAFREKTTDWAKVEAIAGGGGSANKGDEQIDAGQSP